MNELTRNEPLATRPERLVLLPVDQLNQAAGFICHNVPVTTPNASVEDCRAMLLSASHESVSDIAVCEGGQLVGMIRIEDLLAASGDRLARDLMDPDPPFITPGADQEVEAWKAAQRGEVSVGVVDADGNFVGIIPPWRMLSILLRKHDEDVARIGGFLASNSLTITASEESVPRRFWHRMPWLILGLAGATGAAVIVGGYERIMSENLVLAFFLPGIVYMADAVGTQTEAIVIRGLSVGVSIGRVIVRELITGILVGLAMAILFLPIVLLGWGSIAVAIAVALSLFAACSTATVVALSFPWLLNRFGKDPAFGSGPLATVVQDLVSIVIYFVIVGAVVQ